MNANLSGIKPPHPSYLIRPPPVNRTFYVITIGDEVGIIEDVKLMAELRQFSKPRFAMGTFDNWDDAASYYQVEFEAGRVEITSSESALPVDKHIDLTGEITPVKPQQSGLRPRNDSFSRMGSPTPVSGAATNKARGKGSKATNTSSKSSKAAPKPPKDVATAMAHISSKSSTGAPKPAKAATTASGPSAAVTRVKKPRHGKETPPTFLTHEPVLILSSSEEEEVTRVIIHKPCGPAPFPLLTPPFPAAPSPEPAAAATNASVEPLLPAVSLASPDPAAVAPKRKYIKVYLPDGEDSVDSEALQRYVRSMYPGLAPGGPVPGDSSSNPKKARRVKQDTAPGDLVTSPFVRASSAPLLTRILDSVGLAPPVNRDLCSSPGRASDLSNEH